MMFMSVDLVYLMERLKNKYLNDEEMSARI